eukprot:COSAG06_NODE_2200_length_7363_cov_78.787996_4_plen_72_part_00
MIVLTQVRRSTGAVGSGPVPRLSAEMLVFAATVGAPVGAPRRVARASGPANIAAANTAQPYGRPEQPLRRP